MGVGEPLLNINNVVESIHRLNKTYPNNRFALATSLPNLDGIFELGNKLVDIENFKLTISLHATNDKLRKSLIPSHNNIKELIEITKKYKDIYKRKVEWNYILIDKTNDSNECAEELFNLLGKQELVKINKFNNVDGIDFKQSSKLLNFINILKGKGMKIEFYETNGSDINAACGQMMINNI